jgi:hypothetical protein
VTLRLRMLLGFALVGLVLAPTPAGAALPQQGPCTTSNSNIRPAKVHFAGLGSAYGVIPVRRKRNGTIGTPPVNTAGKHLVGWDRYTMPGEGTGTVILDAHTWPDGSALGNAMLRQMHAGQLIVVSNGDGAKVCYQITQRRSYRAHRIPRRKAFRPWGPEQLVVVVCSGKRVGPGKWLRRTIWWATPVS